MTLPQAARTTCRFANPLAGGAPSGPAKPVPRVPRHGLLRGLSIGQMKAPLVCAAIAGAALLTGCASRAPYAPSPGTPVVSSMSAEQSNDAAIQALGLVGTPYRYGGNTPDGGFDCSGLIGYVFRQVGGPPMPRTVARLSSAGQPVPMAQLRTGDLVLFGRSTPSHAGIYVGEGRFVHAPSSGGEVRLDRLDGYYWSRQPLRVRRM
jgi:cell wall-associated NlpC family hydrolase